jgi:hypothetical protein
MTSSKCKECKEVVRDSLGVQQWLLLAALDVSIIVIKENFLAVRRRYNLRCSQQNIQGFSFTSRWQPATEPGPGW